MARIIVLAAAVLMAAQGVGHAAQWESLPDDVVQQFMTQSAGWTFALQRMSFGTFGLLAMISFARDAINLALQKAALEEFIAELVRTVFFMDLGRLCS